MQSEKIKLLAIVGPTATGKTDLSIKLAKALNGEIVCCDSMQIYKGMDIASAKPTAEQRSMCMHYMVDFVPCENSYSVFDYVNDAKSCIDIIHKKGKLPIITGGTGLYADSLIQGITFDSESDNPEIRQQLKKRLLSEGIDKLYEELIKTDPQSAQTIHKNNTKRVLRALEVYYSTGKTMTQQKIVSRQKPSDYEAVYIGLKCHDRQKLYDRINKRVDIMVSQGLVDEAKSALNADMGKTAKMAIGHKELLTYFNGEVSLECALDSLKQQTRRYAKRQLTWFLKNERINWIDIDLFNNNEEIFEQAIKICREGEITCL